MREFQLFLYTTEEGRQNFLNNLELRNSFPGFRVLVDQNVDKHPDVQQSKVINAPYRIESNDEYHERTKDL